jgi:hypothetical protein
MVATIKKPPATTHAVCLTVALEAATLSFEVRMAVGSSGALVKAESGSAAFLFVFECPYLTQLIKASQRNYQS